jgi:hypothetical protein
LASLLQAGQKNGGTQDRVPLAFSHWSESSGRALAFEPEGASADEAIAWDTITWGQCQFTFAPQVDRYKWLECRHMVNISHRWNRDKTDDLQFAPWTIRLWRWSRRSPACQLQRRSGTAGPISHNLR